MDSIHEVRAIKWFNLTHAFGLSLFLAAMIGFFWYLQIIEARHQQQGLYRDIEWAQQSMRLKWREDQDRLMTLAPSWAQLLERPAENSPDVREFLERNPDIVYLAVLDERQVVKWVLSSRRMGQVQARIAGNPIDDSAGFIAFSGARSGKHPVFSPPFVSDDNEVVVELHAPVIRNGVFEGTVIAATSLNRALNYSLPKEVRERYQLMIVDQGGNLLVSSSPRHIHDANSSYELPLDPPGYGIRLRAYVFGSQARVIDRTLLAAVIGLGSASIISLALLWRHARRRMAAEVERDRLFTLSVDPMAIMSRDGRLQRVNPAFQALFPDHDKVTSLPSLAHPLDRAKVGESLTQLSISDKHSPSIQFEARFQGRDDQRWLRWSIRGDGELRNQTLYAVAHDTTERKQAEAALHAESAFRRAMETSIATGMRALDMNGHITYVNRAFCQMLGFEEAELLNHGPPFPYWPQDALAEHQGHLDQILAGQAPPAGLQVKVQRKDGSMLDARLYVSALINEHGQQSGWMTSMTDITEPNRVREQLAAAQQQFITVLDELDAAVSVAPFNSKAKALNPVDAATPSSEPLLFANRFYRGLFGDSEVGHRAWIGSSSSGDSTVESYVASIDRWFEIRSRSIRWVDGQWVRIAVATDITRRREAEQWQRVQAEKFEGNSRLISMGEMASSLAHELNQPLTAIANYCMGLSARIRTRVANQQTLNSDELLDALGKTAAQAERAGRVIRRIRDFVKRSEPEHQNCLIANIVADAVGLSEIETSRQGVRLRLDLAPNLPVVQADPVLIEQVLLNLLKNATDAMRESTQRELVLGVVQRAGQIEFAIIDTGPGIAQEIHDKLFEPFFTTKADGMGMGLNICRSIIEAHRGRLWVENNPTGGCTFRFSIPINSAVPVAQAA